MQIKFRVFLLPTQQRKSVLHRLHATDIWISDDKSSLKHHRADNCQNKPARSATEVLIIVLLSRGEVVKRRGEVARRW